MSLLKIVLCFVVMPPALSSAQTSRSREQDALKGPVRIVSVERVRLSNEYKARELNRKSWISFVMMKREDQMNARFTMITDFLLAESFTSMVSRACCLSPLSPMLRERGLSLGRTNPTPTEGQS